MRECEVCEMEPEPGEFHEVCKYCGADLCEYCMQDDECEDSPDGVHRPEGE